MTYWDRSQTYDGYTFFGAQGTTYLIDMEGQAVHTWPVGTYPRLLDNGRVLDMTNAITFVELDWNGSNVWSHAESRAGYFPHGDFLRIHNPKLGTNTLLYIANKAITSNQCIAAGCNPAAAPYSDVTVDAIVEVDAAGTVVWEWCFFDHGCQDFDAGKPNYVASVSNAPGRINLNLPGRPLTNDWLHCVSLDYNTNLDQVVITAEGGEFYVIGHGDTFIAGDPAGSIALAASTNGDFLYRFGDPARYSQGDPPSVSLNWLTSSTGDKQVGGAGQVTWIPDGLPGAGRFLVFNNGQDLFEHTPQSYIFEVNGYLNAAGNDTGSYVSSPTAGYNTWSVPGHDTSKQKKNISRQVVSIFMSMANQAFFSHLGGSVQRLPNSNLFVCATTEGHLFEVTPASNVVWEYISPITTNGIVSYKRDDWPLSNPVYRATRYGPTHPALVGRTLIGSNTIAGAAPAYVSAPAISGVTRSPAVPYSNNVVSVTVTITNRLNVASATLTYAAGTSTNTVAMTNAGSLYTAQIPAYAAGKMVRYYVTAKDDFDNASTNPVSAPTDAYSYTVSSSVFATNGVLTLLATNLHFAESPAADAAGNIFFSDIPGDTTYKWSTSGQLSIFRTNTGGANGLYFDDAGNLIACERENGRIVSVSPQTNISAVTSSFGGNRYNEPNDLWIDPDGGIYFTDPVFFTNQVPQGGEHVYYITPDTSSVVRVVSDMVKPNGLVGTPDGATLYIADWGAGVVYRYAVGGEGALSGKTAFASVKCDGMTMDSEGNIYLTEDAVLVYSPAGVLLEQLAVPARPTNLEFGDADRKTLFITTDDGCLYSIRMRVQGAGAPTNAPPVIGSVTQSPALPISSGPVTITAVVMDDWSIASATLTYTVGTGSAATDTVFLETMATNAIKPWTGTGCDHAWTVVYSGTSPFEQRYGANYGAGNTNGLEFKNGTTLLTNSMAYPTATINAGGTSGFVEFYISANSQSGTAGWTFQLNSGTGFVTRLSELTGSNHTWQLYHYDLQSSELVSNLAMRFQFRGGQTTNRVDLDQISVKAVTAGSVSSNIAMVPAGGNLYTAQIPAQTAGTAVAYFITAVDALGLVTTGGTYSYVVSNAADVPLAGFTAAPTNGGAPLAVTFVDISTGIITNRSWDFGDGAVTNPTATNVMHTYRFPGTSIVSLTVSGPLGFSTTSRLVVAVSADTVGDGIPDWWRAQHFGGSGATTDSLSCAACDPDEDEADNQEEYLADTNPTNGSSRLEILGITATAGDVALTWIGGSNAWQCLQYSPDLALDQWTAVFTNTPPTLVTNTLMQSGGTAVDHCCYRIKAWRQE